jgi:hypothetical protein
MGWNVTDDDLLPGEEVLVSKLANLWVKPSEYGLSQFAFNHLLGNNESLGGKAHLTTYRILFKTHGVNRLVGSYSIFLPNVVEIRKKLLGIRVVSKVQECSFVMWFSGKFVRTALERRDEMGEDEIADLRELIEANPETLGDGLQKQGGLESINRVLSGVVSAGDVMRKLASHDQSLFAELLALFHREE